MFEYQRNTATSASYRLYTSCWTCTSGSSTRRSGVVDHNVFYTRRRQPRPMAGRYHKMKVLNSANYRSIKTWNSSLGGQIVSGFRRYTLPQSRDSNYKRQSKGWPCFLTRVSQVIFVRSRQHVPTRVGLSTTGKQSWGIAHGRQHALSYLAVGITALGSSFFS